MLKAQNLKKIYGIRTLFEIDSMEIQSGDRIGLVGCNGAGKSTLLNILYGSEVYDAGTVDRRCEVAMVRQSGDCSEEADARLLSGFSLKGSAVKSGGERTRLALAAAFSKRAPLLLADEPTTNLDMDGISLLQKLLAEYEGAFVMVSHDRALLDALCGTIWALEDGGLRVFPGNYTEWISQRDRERAFAQFEYEQYRSEKKRLEQETARVAQEAKSMRKPPRRMSSSEWLLYKDGASIRQKHVQNRAKALQSRIDRMEIKERPASLPQVRMALGTANPISSKTAARVENLTVRYGSHTVLEKASFELLTGKRTVMLGANGAGKTTAVEHLLRRGDCARFANGVTPGYFSQNHEVLDLGRTVLENVRDSSSLPEHEIRTILANLMIAGDDVFKPAGVLSGGERAKAAFAKLLASDCNLLVLDEPTNHIDLYTLEALEALLERWQGTMLIVTHDRRLAERIAHRLLFVETGGIRTFEGSWRQWREDQKRRAAPRDDLTDLIDQMRRAAEK